MGLSQGAGPFFVKSVNPLPPLHTITQWGVGHNNDRRINHKQPDTHVGAVRKQRPTRPKQQKSDKGEKTPKTTCGWCGKAPSHEKQQCPAKDAVCHKCSKRGHFKKVCRSAKVGELHLNTHSETEEDLFLGGPLLGWTHWRK